MTMMRRRESSDEPELLHFEEDVEILVGHEIRVAHLVAQIVRAPNAVWLQRTTEGKAIAYSEQRHCHAQITLCTLVTSMGAVFKNSEMLNAPV